MGVQRVDSSVTGKRGAKRARVLLAARLHTPAGVVDARLRDISRKGALVECKAQPEAGTEVMFERGSTCLSATVAWSAKDRIGLQFAVPINEQELLVHIGKPQPRRDPLPSYSRIGIMRGMSAQERNAARAWSVAVGLTLPEKEG